MGLLAPHQEQDEVPEHRAPPRGEPAGGRRSALALLLGPVLVVRRRVLGLRDDERIAPAGDEEPVGAVRRPHLDVRVPRRFQRGRGLVEAMLRLEGALLVAVYKEGVERISPRSLS